MDRMGMLKPKGTKDAPIQLKFKLDVPIILGNNELKALAAKATLIFRYFLQPNSDFLVTAMSLKIGNILLTNCTMTLWIA